jgi:hypothetical protein
MNTLVSTIVLIFAAGITVPIWLWLVTVIPGIVVKALTSDYYTAMAVMQPISMFLACATVTAAGLFFGLPWYAALIAGVVIGLTTWLQPSPDAAYDA